MHPTGEKSANLLSLRLVLYGSMVALLSFSLYFYKLRTGFSDTPGYLIGMTINDGFFIAHGRFISILNQWLPLLFLKVGASLKAVAIAYSVGYSLVPVALALLCLNWLKRPYHALAIMLMVTLMNMLLFYFTVSELQSGLCLLLFYDALIDHPGVTKNRIFFIAASLLIIPLIAFSHPMLLLTAAGWLCYRQLTQPADYRRTALFLLLFLMAYGVKKLWFTTGYEAGKMSGLDHVQTFGLRYYNGPFARSFYSYIVSEGFMTPVLLLITIALLAWLRRYRLLLLLLVTVAGIYTIVLAAFEDWFVNIYDHYYEHMLQPAVFFIVLIFCYVLAAIPRRAVVKAVAVGCIFLISFSKIDRGKAPHLVRQAWMNNTLSLMDKLGLKKAVMGRNWSPHDLSLMVFWSSGWESLVLSSLDGPQTSKTLLMVYNIDSVKEPVHATDRIAIDGDSYSQQSLPPRYFALGSKPYVFLESVVPDSVLEHLRHEPLIK